MKREIELKRKMMNHVLLSMVAAACLATATDSRGALTDISNAPMASSSSTVVKPNIMFILDDSGSMGWSYLPDTANNFASKYGYKSSQCNGVYYDRNIIYTPPVDATGASYPNASFTAAKTDGFNTGSSTVNLSTSFRAYDSDTSQAAYYYLYSGTQTNKDYTNTNSTFYKECNSSIGSDPGKSVFGTLSSGVNNGNKVIVSATSGPGGTDERTNFANWYSYYRTRMLTMKSAAGRAFKSIDDKYRVGFTTINYTGTDTSNAEFLNISDFNSAQKSSWYSKFYAISPNNSTPLRTALTKAGRIYAGKIGTDPVQYSCQQNFAILTTDGYWNESDPGGYQVDGTTAVGNQDNDLATAPRPFYDGGTTTNASNTLADVAMYYYKTDLRSSALGNCTGALGAGTDVCENNVPGTSKDAATAQHMTTFTLGLGVDGTLKYAENYETGGSADYSAILQGTKNWSKPVSNTLTAVDDLWHTAVNGRGTYFSAKNPDSLVSGLSKALSGVSARIGSAAAAATSNMEPVAGDNYAYIAMYQTVKWDGDLQARTINLNTGEVSASSVWSAQALLDTKATLTADTRTIYAFDNAAVNKLKQFTTANLSSEITAGYFNANQLSQYAGWTTAEQSAATADTLIKYIRGQAGYEDQAGNTYRIYRDRDHVLGDMVDSKPVYVKRPLFNYGDTGYSTFKSNNQNRQGAVYVGANDGMLHAFNADTGQELWAYIPSPVVPNLYKLADKNYSNLHQYYADGSPTVADAYIGGQWKTILVGGLNKGGRGYYALDVTDPANPKALWEYTVSNDSDLGYSFGNPIITKRVNGTWVVLVTSGHNNVSPGDGKGYLYVLDAATGTQLEKIGTSVGSTASPSGLAKINAWVDDSSIDNTARRAYGGDLQGNLWRIDFDNTIPPAGKEAFLLAQFGTGASAQPVTTMPALGDVIDGNGLHHAVVYVGTGRYLGLSDLTDTSQRSLYAIRDDLTATGVGDVRTGSQLVHQLLTSFTGVGGQQMRTVSTVNNVDWSAKYGWYVDFNPNSETPGERVNVDPMLVLGQLIVATNIPNANACNVGGYSWIYFFDYKTGGYIATATSNMVGQKVGNALVVGLNAVKLPNGKVVTIITKSDNTYDPGPNPAAVSPNPGNRVSWRELIE